MQLAEKQIARTLPANQFRRAAKFDEVTLIRLAFCFCNGVPVRLAAASVNLSTKTARTIYLQFRRRLTHPKFNRWHGAYQRLARMPSVDSEMLVRTSFIDTLAECGLNETCYRNFRLGNRKSRLCRSCRLPQRFSSADRVNDALGVIDTVQAFYAMLGIRGETDIDPLVLFRLRLIHATTIATAREASRIRGPKLTGDHLKAFRSVRTLIECVVDDGQSAQRPTVSPPRGGGAPTKSE